MYIHDMQDGNTALELTKDAATFECLRAAGAKMPDITDENKNALLLHYAEEGAAPLVRVLLEAGANVAHTDEAGFTPLDLANADEVKAALREHGGKHSLFYAVQEGMPELVSELLKEGADVHEKNGVSLDRVSYSTFWML